MRFMGRRKRKKVVYKPVRRLPRVFSCPNCGHKTIKTRIEKDKSKQGPHVSTANVCCSLSIGIWFKFKWHESVMTFFLLNLFQQISSVFLVTGYICSAAINSPMLKMRTERFHYPASVLIHLLSYIHISIYWCIHLSAWCV